MNSENIIFLLGILFLGAILTFLLAKVVSVFDLTRSSAMDPESKKGAPLSIKIIGWYFILVSCFGSLSLASSVIRLGLENGFHWRFALALLTIALFGLAGILIGKGLLGLRKWAFVLTFVLILLSIVNGFITSPIILVPGFIISILIVFKLFEHKKAFGYE